MEVKAGYKLTEIGVIPEEWEVSRLGDCGEVVMGQSPPGASYNRAGIGSPLINGPTEFTDKSPIKMQWTTEPTRFCKTADLLICVRGSSTGRTNVADEDYCIGRGVAAIRARPNNDTSFLSYQVVSAVSRILAAATGSTFPSIDGISLRRIAFPLPPRAEQQAIAAALGDVDALIGSLDQLIAKKRDLKQAAMQQLLTGQTRLPGFSGQWETKRFDELFQFLNTANNPRSDLNEFGEVGYIHYGDIHTHPSAFLDCATVPIPHIDQNKVKGVPFVEDGDLVMVDASEDYTGIGKCAEVTNVGDRIIVAGLHTFLLRGDKKRLANGFKGYLQFLPAVRSALIRLATGISVYGVSKGNVKSIEVRLPPLKEQTAIAEVLTDIDSEIAALENRRDKTRLLKQGMMQELLTGRTRLV